MKKVDAEKIPDETIQQIVADPRNALTTLLGREPKAHRLSELTGLLKKTSQAVQQVVAPIAPAIESRELTDVENVSAMQDRVEQCFSGFHGQIIAGLDHRMRQGRYDATFNTAVQNPFHIVNANKKNSYTNAAIARKDAGRRGIHLLYVANGKLRDPRHFLYDIEQGEAAAMQGFAGFAPVERRMVLPPNFDPNNPLHFLVTYHETVHVMHAAHWLMSGGQGFVDFYTRERPSVILNEEFDAYALEVEALNLLLNDELRTMISSGRTPDVDTIADRLGIPQEERQPLGLILNLAEKYYPEGSVTVSQKPQEFMGRIAANQASYGYDLFLREGSQLRNIRV